jgi:serine/threonine-protein kinase RsbW
MNLTPSPAVHLRLASRFENIEVAERALLELCRQVGCRGDEEYWLVSALREVLANAIRHGNHGDPERMVTVEYAVEEGSFIVTVEDEGDGFDPEEVPDPTAPENLLRPSGRGIFYMRQFMDNVTFDHARDGGTLVKMVRRLQQTPRSSHHEE